MINLKNCKNTKYEKLMRHIQSISDYMDNENNFKLDFDNFEKISFIIKELNKENIKFHNNEEVENLKYKKSKIIEKFEKLKSNYKYINHRNKDCYIQNLIKENESLKKLGIGLSFKECYIIQNKLKMYSNLYNPVSIRFFGKILGKIDYYVIEMRIKNITEINLKDNIELEGTNSLTHLVTTNIKNDWIELPLVKPEDIQQSKLFQYLFTGNLNQEIKNNKFNGKERNYLKAIITRINHSNIISPKEFYKETEEGKIERNDEFTLNIEEIKNLSNWSYSLENILNCGRCSHFIKNLSEEEVEKIQNEDPKVEKLKSISEDSDEKESNWKIRLYGDNEVINHKDKEETFTYELLKIYNKVWEGSFTYLNLELKEWNNFYFGYGIKENQLYMPITPNIIWQETEDLEEYPEPNPQNPPSEKIETDSEDEEEN